MTSIRLTIRDSHGKVLAQRLTAGAMALPRTGEFLWIEDQKGGQRWFEVTSACLGFPKSQEETQLLVTVAPIERDAPSAASPPVFTQIGEAEEVSVDENTTVSLDSGLAVSVGMCSDDSAEVRLSEKGVPSSNRVFGDLDVGEELVLKSVRGNRSWKATLLSTDSFTTTLSVEEFGIE